MYDLKQFVKNHEVALIRSAAVLVLTMVVASLLSLFTSLSYQTAVELTLGLTGLTLLIRVARPYIVDYRARRQAAQEASGRIVWPWVVGGLLSGFILLAAFFLTAQLSVVVTSSHLAANIVTALLAVLHVILVVGVVGALYPLFYALQVQRKIVKRRPDAQRAAIRKAVDTSLIRIDDITLDSLRHKLVLGDQEIHIAMRKHSVSPFLETVAPVHVKTVPHKVGEKTRKLIYRNWWRFTATCFSVISLIVVLVYLTSVSVRPPWLNPTLLIVKIVVLSLYLGALAGKYAQRKIEWQSWFLIVTDQRVQVIVQWPAWLYTLQDRAPQLEMGKIIWCEALDQDNWISNAVRTQWGTVDIDGQTEHDGDLNAMTELPDAAAVAGRILQLKTALTNTTV